MISIIPKSDITADDLKCLKQLSPLSLGEIKKASQQGRSICNIETFGQYDGMTDSERDRLLVQALSGMQAGNPPYRLYETYENGDREELTAETLRNRIEHFHDIKEQVIRDDGT